MLDARLQLVEGVRLRKAYGAAMDLLHYLSDTPSLVPSPG